VRDELQNLEPLLRAVAAALEGRWSWELVLVDDGSRDGSRERIAELALADRRVVGLANDRGRGQTSALCAGFRAARGGIVAMLDADLQNDPAELPAMIRALARCDAVVGYRVRRHDSWLRRLSSRVGNGVRNRLTGDFVRDTGCSLKVFRAEAIRSLALFEGMHRFLPTLLRWHGWRVLEHPVSHRPRERGRSKYGVANRALRGLADVLAVRWMRRRIIPPHLGSLRLGPLAPTPRAPAAPAREPAVRVRS
jgi:glycosyltransferase involved in cell wall biosynthesis